MNRKAIFFLGICNVLGMQLFSMEEGQGMSFEEAERRVKEAKQQVAEQEKNINEIKTSTEILIQNLFWIKQ